MSGSSVLFDVPGPRARRRNLILTALAGLLLLALALVAVRRLDARGELDWAKWQPIFGAEAWRYYYLPGLLSTLKAAAAAVVLAGIFGLVLGMGRLSQHRAIRWLSGVVVEFFRAVPVLIMMIAFFSFLAYRQVFSPETNPFVAVVAALTLYNGAVIAELVRSGVGSLPRGQAEAGLSIGLTPSQTLRSIQLPQALTAMLPALVSQLVVILKDSALGAIITYPELLAQARNLASYQSNSLQALVTAAVLFIAVNMLLSWLAGRLERRVNRRGRTAATADADRVGTLDAEEPGLTGEGTVPGRV